jgi:hypothetical protein
MRCTLVVLTATFVAFGHASGDVLYVCGSPQIQGHASGDARAYLGSPPQIFRAFTASATCWYVSLGFSTATLGLACRADVLVCLGLNRKIFRVLGRAASDAS